MAAELVVDGLSVARAGRRVLSDVSFALRPGDVVAVVGPNGAGKTSLLQAIVGLVRAADGHVTFDGKVLRSLSHHSAVFSYMPDDTEPPGEATVHTVIAHAERFGRPPPHLAGELKERLGVGRLAAQRAGRLSRGEKRRVALFAALCTARPVVVLDEPLATFDPLQLLEVLPVLRERAAAGTALLLSVHQMSDAEKVASQILVLDGGAVVAFGALAALRARVDRSDASLEVVVLELLRGRERDVRA